MRADNPLLFIKKIDIPMILKEVSQSTDIPVPVILTKSRKREIVIARQISMRLAKEFTSYSLAKIGSQIGGKDHATVLHACKTINNLVDTKDDEVTTYFIPLHKKMVSINKAILESKPVEPKTQEELIFNTEK